MSLSHIQDIITTWEIINKDCTQLASLSISGQTLAEKLGHMIWCEELSLLSTVVSTVEASCIISML